MWLFKLTQTPQLKKQIKLYISGKKNITRKKNFMKKKKERNEKKQEKKRKKKRKVKKKKSLFKSTVKAEWMNSRIRTVIVRFGLAVQIIQNPKYIFCKYYRI